MPTLTFDSPLGLALCFVAGFFASGINAFAGGGTLVSFPVLIGLGVPDLRANATNSMALWPGSLSSAFGFWENSRSTVHHYRLLVPATVLGATSGAVLLVATSQTVFKIAIPFLLLFATLILAYQKKIRTWIDQKHGKLSPLWGAALQFVISVYGGYFGAGMGIMMLAAMSLFVDGTLHELNALKNWLAVLINVVAMGWFLGKGLVLLGPALAMMGGAVLGGYVSAKLTQKVAPDKLRTAVVAYGLVMSSWFFYRAFYV